MSRNPSWLPTYSSQITRRRFLAGTAAGIGAAALIACGGGGKSTEVLTIDPSGVRKPGNIVYAKDNWKLADETAAAVAGGVYPGRETAELANTFDPFLSTSSVDDVFADHVYEYPVKLNRGPGIAPGTLEYSKIVGNVAEKWELSNDASTYTFTIRQGVKYHPIAPVNGREMDIDDWKATWSRFAEIGSNRQAVLDQVDKVEFPDSKHMVLKMKAPSATFMTRMLSRDFSFKIVPKELCLNPDLMATKQIGTNYKITDKVQPSITRDFKRFDGYWGGKPFIDRWQYPIIPEYANGYSQFITQHIISFTPTNQDALNLRKDASQALMVAGEINIFTTPYSSFGKPEIDTAPWKDPRVRIALRKVIDYDAILDFQSGRQAFNAVGIEVETAYNTHASRDPMYWLDPRQGELGDASKNYFYDVAEAKKLVEAAGHPDGFDITQNVQRGANTELIGLMDDYYNKSGFIRVKQNIMEMGPYYDNVVYAPNLKGFNGTSSGAGSATDIDHVLANLYESGGRQGAFTDAKMDQMIKAQRREIDPNKRAEILKDWQRYIATQFYALPTRQVPATWSVEWPWLHNVNQAGQLQWLDATMPHRNG